MGDTVIILCCEFHVQLSVLHPNLNSLQIGERTVLTPGYFCFYKQTKLRVATSSTYIKQLL